MLPNPGQVISGDRTLEKVWGYDFMGESNLIEVYIRALRIKLEASNSKRRLHNCSGSWICVARAKLRRGGFTNTWEMKYGYW